MVGRTSGANRFYIDKFSKVLGLRGMEKVVGNRDDFVMDAHRGEMMSFGGSSYCASKGVLQ